MNKEEFLKILEQIPKTKDNKCISTYGSVNAEDLLRAVEKFKKVPTYDELLRENKRLNEKIQKAIGFIKEHKDKICYLDRKHNKYKSKDDYILKILESEDICN